jgi:signal peptidase II
MGKWAFVTVVAAGVLVADQLTKWWIRDALALYESIPVLESIFHITYVRNTGGAFSFLAGTHDAFRVPFFLAASAIAIGVLAYFLSQVPPADRLLLFALSGVLGGALGNLIDRVTLGHVTDFIDVQFRGRHWPAFNVADSFISIGVIILLAHSLFAPDRDEETTK